MWDHDMEKLRTEGKLKFRLENNPLLVNYIPNTVDETTELSRLLTTEDIMFDSLLMNKSETLQYV